MFRKKSTKGYSRVSEAKSITTLIPDIHSLLEGEIDLDKGKVEEFSSSLSSLLVDRLTKSDYSPALRMSNFGTPCSRQIWYKINTPEDAEPLPPEARLKFLFGDILEELLLFLAKEAGHDVRGEQDELDVEGVKGHRDAVIDGVTVDVKSANARSFAHFKAGALSYDNPFHAAYLDQIDLYLEAGRNDPLVKEKKVGAFLAFDKERGGICLSYHGKQDRDYSKEVDKKNLMLAAEDPPPRGFEDVEDGKSGNRKLGLGCSYCSFKDKCWPNLRTFIYSNGPRFLTKVVRVPDVPEASPKGAN